MIYVHTLEIHGGATYLQQDRAAQKIETKSIKLTYEVFLRIILINFLMVNIYAPKPQNLKIIKRVLAPSRVSNMKDLNL